uniref:Uncharacterized protein n=1 Tax=Anguilla anguilla TaxID=7936 RepID=A0A0E9X0F0_ANGAN
MIERALGFKLQRGLFGSCYYHCIVTFGCFFSFSVSPKSQFVETSTNSTRLDNSTYIFILKNTYCCNSVVQQTSALRH